MTMLHRRAVRRSASLAAAGALALGALGTAGAASAESSGFQDAHGDIKPGADIWNVRVTNARSVRVDIRHADLVPSYKSGAGVAVYLDTDRRKAGPEFVFLGGLFEGTDYALLRAKDWRPVGSAVPLRCSYIMRLDYSREMTHIRIGRACLDGPGKVRVAVRSGGERPDGTRVRDWLDGRRVFTPWVSRG